MECRLCLRSEPSVAIFDFENSLHLKIWNCCRVEVKINDGLPQKICSTCVSELNSFSKFKDVCTMTDITLRNRYSHHGLRDNNKDNFEPPPTHHVVLASIKQEIDPIYDEYSTQCLLYTCYECGESLPDEHALKQHQKQTHSMDEGYREVKRELSSSQNGTYDNIKHIIKSEISQSSESTYDNINVCEVMLENDMNFNANDEKKCSVCGEIFATTTFLKKHIKVSHLKLINVENHVGPTFKTTSGEIGKKVKLKFTDQHTCNKCGKTLSDRRCFQKHLLAVHLNILLNELRRHGKGGNGESHKKSKKSKTVPCTVCDLQLPSKEHFVSHVSSQHFDIMHGLEGGGKVKRDDETLDIILSKALQKKKAAEYPRECNICGKSVYKLREHMQRHEQKKGDFSCDVCQKPFKTKDSLSRHKVYIHSQSNRIPCNVCGKIFPKIRLSAHLLSHSTVILFECDYCGKGFKEKQSFVHHIMGHMGMKPHKCEICFQGFLLKQTLKSHILQHTGENPFKCELCPKAFKQRCNLKSHMRHYHKKVR